MSTAKSKADHAAVRHVNIQRVGVNGKRVSLSDALAVEAPLEIRIHGRGLGVTMRTPGHDRELVAGFLLTERIVRNRRELKDIATCRGSFEPQNTMDVFLSGGVEVDFARLTRHVYATSSCGLCGKATIDAVRQNFPPVDSNARISVSTLRRLPALMRQQQTAFAQTGGLHAGAIFDLNGEMFVLREDIGRHNAVDKAIGYGFLKGRFPLAAHVLLVSGRASLEIMQKSLAARIPIVCAVSAPSSLAVDFAKDSGQTLVGFLRDDTMNVYTGGGRIED